MTNIQISDSAAEKIAALLKEENNPTLKLRIFVQGGGCSGFQYGFTFDDDKQEDDIVTTKTVNGNEITIVIDPISHEYLSGIEIDYTEDISGSQFVIKNPLAKSTCGCGSSFSV